MLATEKVKQDLLHAKDKGNDAMKVYIKERLSEEATKTMFDPIKKLNLGTFSNMAKTVKVSIKDKQVQ